jgi:acyl-CoA synthetase (AMP-forming)/AMP-acid ligase II
MDVSDLRRHASTAPHRIAVTCGNEHLSYGELEALANRLAAGFRALGLRRGDHVAALIDNRPLLLAIGWGAWRCGLILTPMPTSLSVPEWCYLIEDGDAKAVLCDASFSDAAAAMLGRVAGDRHWLSVHGSIMGFSPIESLIESVSPLPHSHEPPGALMMYTSGTTGSPKGVIRPLLPAEWRGTPPFAADLIGLFGLGGTDVRYLSTAPLYHAAALRCALAVTAGGGTVHVMQRFDADLALQLLEREAITHSQWVPAMFQRLLALPAQRRAACAAPAHRVAIHGAAPCPPAIKRAMIDWWGPILLEYYSGTEGAGLTLIDSEDWTRHPGSVGRARKGKLHIVDDAGRELPSGTTGRVFFSGVPPFAYHGAPEKTAAATLHGSWQTFGDLGRIDDEGYLYLSDRRDDLILSGGVNIYPQEIEAAIRVVPGVADCAVVGLHDERFGERPVAFLVPQPGNEPEALVAAVHRHCSQCLGRFKQPTQVVVLDALPRSPTGKLMRRALRQRASPKAKPE